MRTKDVFFLFLILAMTLAACSDDPGQRDGDNDDTVDAGTDAVSDADADKDTGADADVDPAPGEDWAMVSTGERHSCAIDNDQALWCWGQAGGGKLGLGETYTDRPSPERVGQATDWQSVSVGMIHSCGVRDDGTLWCWGQSHFGQAGLGDDVDYATTPEQVGEASDWASVSAARTHTCGVRDDGTLWCWGANNFGQLGIGAELNEVYTTPQQVGDDTDWDSVSCAVEHSCAVREDGTLWCWGLNSHGRLGLGEEDDLHKDTPTRVGEEADWALVAAGGYHTCGVRQDGTLWCWGDNSAGQTGLDDVIVPKTPMQVGESEDWTMVTSGRLHSCGLRDDETLWCWGSHARGQLGLGDDSTGEAVPRQVEEGRSWTSVTTHEFHSCAIDDSGGMHCWGYNSYGQLGAGETLSDYGGTKNSPISLDADSSVHQISAGRNHGCLVADDETLWCWGAGLRGQLGDGGSDDQTTPVQAGDEEDWTTVTAGESHSCGLRGEGALWCWGSDTAGQLGVGDAPVPGSGPHPVETESDWESLSAGSEHNCGIRDDGTLWCWGRASWGRLGLGEHTTSGTVPEPDQVGEDTDWATVSAGDEHSCGVREDGTLWCWGRRGSGRLGLGTGSGNQPAPEQVGEESNWATVSAGDEHTCGIRDDGTLWCWGRASDGRLGLGEDTTSGTVSEPDQVGEDTDWATVSAGFEHTCGLRYDETLWCWGSGGRGQLGLGNTPKTTSPTQVDDERTWSSVTTGRLHTHAVDTTDQGWSWGRNHHGQLGDGTLWVRAPVVVTTPD